MTTGLQPFSLTVYSKGYVRQGVVNAPLSVEGAVRVGAPGELTFSVHADERRLAALGAEGARVRCDYRYDQDAEPMTLISGPVNEASGDVKLRGGVKTFTVTDDWNIFNDWLGLPNPTGTQTQQGDDGAYYTLTGAAETVLKGHVTAARNQIGETLTIPATLGRGPTVTVAMRMMPLADRLFPTVSSDDLVVRVLQLGDVRTLVVTTPTLHERVLTQESGIVVEAQIQQAPPTITRAVIGAGGEAEARIFRFKVNTTWETKWERKQRFIDARDVSAVDPNLEAILTQRWFDAQAEGAPRSGIAAVLAETPRWRFGKTFQLGDKVTIRLANSEPLADFVREVQFRWDLAGRSIVPVVGNWQESVSDKIWAAVSRSMRAQRIEQGSR